MDHSMSLSDQNCALSMPDLLPRARARMSAPLAWINASRIGSALAAT